MTWEDRFWAKVQKTDGCWLWAGARQPKGYGTLHVDGRTRYAHRLSVELSGRLIPSGMVVDHLCRNPPCVNPDHLDVVTSRVNSMRGEAPTVVVRRTGVCKRGHSMDDAIVTIRSSGVVARRCRECQRVSTAKMAAKQAEQRKLNRKPLKTHCLRGHEFTPENIRWRTDGSRSCRTCDAYWNGQRQPRRREWVK